MLFMRSVSTTGTFRDAVPSLERVSVKDSTGSPPNLTIKLLLRPVALLLRTSPSYRIMTGNPS